MKKISTHVLNQKDDKEQVVAKPKKSTIEFLQQFARAYKFEKEMPIQLGGFIAN